MVWLTISTDVLSELSNNKYPVGITSKLYSLINFTPLTCSSIKYLGFLPLKRLVNSIASAYLEICFEEPGKRIIGL